MAERTCIFCKIVRREMSAQIAFEDHEILAFEDINPVAPVHLLVIPKRHVATLNDLQPGDDALFGRLQRVAAQMARERGIVESGWRATVNVGRDAHQLVYHVHLHVMGGRPFSWPPG